AALFLWLASQLNPVLGLANRPTAAGGVAGEAAADVVAVSAEQGLAMALAELAGLQQLERLVGKVEQADQIGDRRPATADTAIELLLGEAELIDQGGAGASLVDRIEVLAHHVLDQRHLQPLGQLLVTDHRRDLLQAGGLSRAPASFAGDQLVAAVGEGAYEEGLHDAVGLDRGGEAGERLGVDLGPWLIRIRLDQLDRQLEKLARLLDAGLRKDRREATA